MSSCRDDQILLQGLLFYIFNTITPLASFLPTWRSDGIIISILLHVGPVEYLYYWLHRALHHHYLYSRYHSHHHSSIVTEPISCKNTSVGSEFITILSLYFGKSSFLIFVSVCIVAAVIHPFAEHIAYFLLFAIPLLGTVFTGTASLVSLFGYITYIDLMNNMGHCNFELIPKWAFSIFPPLKYLMYTPS